MEDIGAGGGAWAAAASAAAVRCRPKPGSMPVIGVVAGSGVAPATRWSAVSRICAIICKFWMTGHLEIRICCMAAAPASGLQALARKMVSIVSSSPSPWKQPKGGVLHAQKRGGGARVEG